MTCSDKPDVYIWEYEAGKCPVTFLPEYMYNNVIIGAEGITSSYNDKPIDKKREEIIADYNNPVTQYFNVHTRIIGKDIPVHTHVNIIFVPCIDFSMLLHIIATIPQNVYNFCKEYNVKICINYILECLSTNLQKKIDEYVNKFFIKKGYDIKYIKIIVNAFDSIKSGTNNIYIYKNMFDIFLFNCFKKNYINHINDHYFYNKKRKYKFSVLFGLLHNRYHRVQFLNSCKKNNLINTDFFYSIICMNDKNTHMYVKNILSHEDYNNVKELIYHKVYNNEGNKLKIQDDFYYDKYEYGIPRQVLESYITVVLETIIDMPSVTEKIYKPLLCGVPFLWLGCKNIGKHLVQQGYKLYPFIDYSFDEKETSGEREAALIKEMLRLRDIDLEYHINNTKDIAKYNANNFITHHYTMNDLYNKLKDE